MNHNQYKQANETVRYVKGDKSRIWIENIRPETPENEVKARQVKVMFLNKSRGLPGYVHGGAVGSIYCGLADWFVASKCAGLKSFSVRYLQMTKMNLPLWVRSSDTTRVKNDISVSAALYDEEGKVLSSAKLLLSPTLIPSVQSPARLASQYRKLFLFSQKVDPIALFDHNRLTNSIYSDPNQTRFEFVDDSRLSYDGFLQKIDTGSEQQNFTLHWILEADASRTVSDQSLSNELWLSEGALLTAVDEIAGLLTASSYNFPSVTGSLKMDFLKRLCFTHDVDGKREKIAFYMRAEIANKKAENSRRIFVSCNIFALVPSVPQSFEHFTTLPQVAHGECVFVALQSSM